VRVLKKEKTIRMHYANCNTFNADFDGDEINLHCPQDPVARAEALFVASADRQFLGPTAGQPLRGLIQDHVVGGTTLTARDTFLTRAQVQQLLYVAIRAALKEDVSGNLSAPGKGGNKEITRLSVEDIRLNLPRPAVLKPAPLWTGKQVITCFLHAPIPGGGISIDSKARTQGDLWGGVLDGKKKEFETLSYSKVSSIRMLSVTLMAV
jgi:DNA-directed RNA polymerase I subunit RPA1